MSLRLGPVILSGKKIDKSLFQVKQRVLALLCLAKDCGKAMKELKGAKGLLLSIPKMTTIIPVPDNFDCRDKPSKRMLLLDPALEAGGIDGLPELLCKFALQSKAILTSHEIILDYEYWSTDQILRAIIPTELEVPSSFSSIGHIAHLNLRKDYEPYKYLIGQVLLDKNKAIKTVVNKTDSIDHTFRFFSMELLAGEDNTVASLREGQCSFTFDFAKVYWNSRLQTEHDRVVSMFKPGQLICDVFAGVGPFALPAARVRECVVFANDLNPMSHEYLTKNVLSNKVSHRVACFNMDGREFIEESMAIVKEEKYWKGFKDGLHFSLRRTDKKAIPVSDTVQRAIKFDHYLMNLPATATDFLDAFTGLYHNSGLEDSDLPMIHCYSFSKAEDLVQDTIQKTEAMVGQISKADLLVHKVRNVAPNKDMMCISFRLPHKIAFAPKTAKRKRE